MRTTSIIIFSLLFMASFSYAQDITISIGKEKKEEKPAEEKKEEKKELPKPAQLNISAVNLTAEKFIVSAKATVVGSKNRGIVVQHEIGKNSTFTIASLFDPDPEAEFSLKEYELILQLKNFNQGIACHIEEKKDNEGSKDEGGKEEGKEEEGKDEGASEQAPAEEGDVNIAKKSINFLVFVPPNQVFPICRIYLDQ